MSADALDAVAAEADAIGQAAAEGDAPAGAPAAPPPQSPNLAALQFLLAGFREVACMLLKVDSLHRTLDDEKVTACATVLAPVADKYGIRIDGVMGGVEAQAIMVAGPILWAAYRELDSELRAKRRKPATATEGATDARPSGDLPAPPAMQ